MDMSHPGGFRQTVSTVSVSLASDANDEIKMSSKLNAESIGDWACTMANGIKGEPVRGGRKRGREHLPLPVRSGCRLCARPCYWSHSPISSKPTRGCCSLRRAAPNAPWTLHCAFLCIFLGVNALRLWHLFLAPFLWSKIEPTTFIL